jgi:hypothetical protein
VHGNADGVLKHVRKGTAKDRRLVAKKALQMQFQANILPRHPTTASRIEEKCNAYIDGLQWHVGGPCA